MYHLPINIMLCCNNNIVIIMSGMINCAQAFACMALDPEAHF